VKRQLAVMDRRFGNCAQCKSAELQQHLRWLQAALANGPG
jgi:hypothetical protein